MKTFTLTFVLVFNLFTAISQTDSLNEKTFALVTFCDSCKTIVSRVNYTNFVGDKIPKSIQIRVSLSQVFTTSGMIMFENYPTELDFFDCALVLFGKNKYILFEVFKPSENTILLTSNKNWLEIKKFDYGVFISKYQIVGIAWFRSKQNREGFINELKNTR